MSKTTKHKELGFNLPEGYFKTLRDRVIDTPGRETQAGFAVPEGYFESLECRLHDTIVPQGKLLQLPPLRKTWSVPMLAIAAALLALVALNGVFSTTDANAASLAGVENEVLMEYLLKQPLMEETATLSYLYAATALPENTTLVSDVADEVLIEYLINNEGDNPYLE